jgi:LmbE family N-acetylglucosaminyl deacetylase
VKRLVASLSFVAATAILAVGAPVEAQSLPETVEAISRARVSTRIVYITAHPDDEASALLTYLSRGLGADVALLTLTRGEGGQNAIGPELGVQLGMLRTDELLAASRHNGVRQFFTRAPDFGYSKSAEQALKIWGDLPLEDMVRVIRTFRPQIVINGWGGVHTGHGQHQASGILTPRAVAAAADPRMFPEQIQEGLAVWQASLILDDRREEAPGGFRVPLDGVSPLWGKSYNELGRESLAYHRSQGVSAFFDSPFFRRPRYLLVEGGKDQSVQLNQFVLAAPLPSLAARFPTLRDKMEPALTRADQAIEAAHAVALELKWAEAAADLAGAGNEIAALEKELNSGSPASGSAAAEPKAGALWELHKARQLLDAALADAVALHLEARADRSELVAGETFSIRASQSYRPDVGLKSFVAGLEAPPGWRVTPEGDHFSISIPRDAEPPSVPGDAVLPWPSPLVRLHFEGVVDGYTFSAEEPVVAVRATSTRVDTYPLALVPAVTLTIEPRLIALEKKGASAMQVKTLVRVRYHGSSPADVSVGLDVPPGWVLTPNERLTPLDFTGPSDQLLPFVARPTPQVAPRAYLLKPRAQLDEKTYRTSLEQLPSLPTRSWSEPAEAIVHVIDLAVPAKLRIGYISAGNDPIPDIVRQLGIQVDLLDEATLAFGDLSGYDAVVVGIRGYELRDDLARANHRLLDYVQQGGTLVVQYQRDFAWARVLPAPFPATMGQPAARVTDPDSPVRFLAQENPLLNFPNKITPDDFKGWVQERGLYFWGQFDPRYQAVLGLRDPGEEETTGGLVYARDGKGVYVYTGLSFFRELPAGVPGAFRLFVNLLSQSRLNPPTEQSRKTR